MRPAYLSLAFAAALGCGGGSTVSPDASTPRADVPRDSGYPSVCGMSLGACNWVTNEGCDAGAGCYRSSGDGGARQLCAAPGVGLWGASCVNANDCAPGLACLGEPGRCTPLCCGEDHARCGDPSRGGRPGGLCVGAVVGTDTRFCIEPATCDHLATSANGCPMDRPRCDVIASPRVTACGAIQGTPGGDGDPCCRSERCAAGYACIRDNTLACSDASPNGVCRRFCAPAGDAGSACPAGQACTLRFEGLPAEVSACAPPR